MARGIVSKSGLLALVCAVVALIGELSSHVAGDQSVDENLLQSLNSWDLTTDQIEAILNKIEHKDETKIGEYTVQQVLDFKDLTLDKCEWLANTVLESDIASKLSVNRRVVPGAYEFVKTYYNKLEHECFEQMEVVVKKAISHIEADGNRMYYVNTYFKSPNQYVPRLVAGQAHFNLAIAPGIERACDEVLYHLRVTDIQRFNHGTRGREAEKAVLGQDWFDIKQNCATYLNRYILSGMSESQAAAYESNYNGKKLQQPESYDQLESNDQAEPMDIDEY